MYIRSVIVMAGGLGSRLGGLKKQFLRICGKRLIDVAIDVAKAIVGKGVVYVCIRDEDIDKVSEDDGVVVLVCPGKGYVEDLVYALNRVPLPALVLPADIPLLTVDVVKKFLEKAGEIEGDVVTLMICRDGVCRESGLSMFRAVGGAWNNVYFEEVPELRDVDTFEDLIWAEKLCESMEGIERRGSTSAQI